MTRELRIESSTGIYHVMMRGNNKQTIFWDAQDFREFLLLIHEKKEQKSLFPYAWCLMPNHIHLLIKEKQEAISLIFQSIQTRFVMWYNKKTDVPGMYFRTASNPSPLKIKPIFCVYSVIFTGIQ